eukprot:TRINITY_DN6603_c0_g1_i4.p1 TRINITY_DN6603_c0_g1~~TRINITY_DN6603_c0_g1_i4.p1  ORF type:complete len:275 (+),score=67.36 TRINITY_DN6603_c0_g1_i4:88-912(+)
MSAEIPSFEDYVRAVGLDPQTLEQKESNQFTSACFARHPDAPLDEQQIANLFSYKVPRLGRNGGCALRKEILPEPFSLASFFKLPPFDTLASLSTNALPASDLTALSQAQQEAVAHILRLFRLNQVAEALQQSTACEWVGIYQRYPIPPEDDVLECEGLVKQAYRGEASRAIFPLTAEFAATSNNSTVALTGKSVLIQDVMAHEGPYYQCSQSVKSEFCVPIFSWSKRTDSSANPALPYQVIGIIDAEAWREHHFTPAVLTDVLKVAYDLGLYL